VPVPLWLAGKQAGRRWLGQLTAVGGLIFLKEEGYLDDHLIASRTLDEHLQHFRTYFQLLQDNGLQINPAKCVFAVAEVDFLGHRVSAAGILPLPKHVEALQCLLVPTNVKGLQRFLGLINFYRRFLPGIAATLLPLTDALRGLPQHLTVTAEMTAAVAAAKDALAAATGLAHPLPHAQLALVTDVSDSHVGGVLQQWEGAAWRPLSFFSQKPSPAQSRYSTFDRAHCSVFCPSVLPFYAGGEAVPCDD
jgi:RNase H-like domain found in reverse transcriptase/Reverse transcriptase (RNA-dependent DNA polymerase)